MCMHVCECLGVYVYACVYRCACELTPVCVCDCVCM